MDGKTFRFHDLQKTHKNTKVIKKSSFTQFKAFYDALNES